MVATWHNDAWVNSQDVDKSDIRGGIDTYVILATTITELRTLDTGNLAFVRIDDYIWYYDSGDAASADDGVDVIVTNDSKRFKRRARSGIPAGGSNDQLLALVSGAPAWIDAPTELPALGTDGQLLGVSSGALAYIDPPTELPTIGNDNEVLTVVSGALAYAAVPTELPALGSNGQFLGVSGGALAYLDLPEELPTLGTNGQILTVVSGALAYADPPTELPALGSEGQLLGVSSGALAYINAPTELPALGSNGQILTVVSGALAYADAPTELPGGGSNGQVLKIVSGAPAWATDETGGGGGGAGTNPNLLINGDMQLNQRGFAGGAITAGDYFFDRWRAATGGANVTLSGYTITLASGEIEQVIETAQWGLDSLASTALTISVEAPSADLTIELGSQSGTLTSGAGRQSLTLTLGAGDTGNITLSIAKATGSNVTFGRVKVEVGSSATDWQARPVIVELRMAQRYFESSYNLGDAPGTTYALDGAVGGSFFSRGLYTTQHWQRVTRFNVPKRATPTMTIYDMAGNSNRVSLFYANQSSGTSDNFTVTTVLHRDSVYTYSDNSNGKSGCFYHYTADAEL